MSEVNAPPFFDALQHVLPMRVHPSASENSRQSWVTRRARGLDTFCAHHGGVLATSVQTPVAIGAAKIVPSLQAA
jgi:hypothetical protein